MIEKSKLTENVPEMLSTILALRERDYPDIPEELVKEIVVLEERYFDNRSEVRGRIERIVDAFLKQGSV